MSEPTTAPARGAVSARAVFIGVVLAAVLCAVTPYNDFKVGATYIAGTQFPVGSLFVLFVLAAGVNVVLRKLRPQWAFRRGELLTIWTLITVASGLPSSGMMRYFLPHIVAPTYFSNTTNNWQFKIWGASPGWLFVQDKAAADAFFVGYRRGQEHIPWAAWAGPLFFWGLLTVLFFVATFCVANVLRRQWVENEKFAFPLVTLPVLLAEEPRSGRLVNDFLRSPLLWVAVGLMTAVHTLRGLHVLYPAIPNLPLEWNVSDWLTVRPWNTLGWFPMIIFFLAVGLAYLLPADVGFSLWFFFLFYKAEILLCTLYNWQNSGPLGGLGQKEFHTLQAFGGSLGLFLWTLWTAKSHLRDVWDKAVGGARAAQIDDTREMFGYRATLAGLIVSYGGIGLWLWFAGVGVGLILFSLLLMTVTLVLISWVVTQAGMLFMQTTYASIDVLGPTVGTAALKVSSLYTVYRWEGMFLYDTREMLIPSVLNGAKTADAAHFSPRPLFRAMILTLAVGLFVSAVASLWVPYYSGGGNSLTTQGWTYRSAPTRPLGLFGGAASAPYPGAPTNYLHVLGGFAGVLGLLILRAQFGVGLHPIGFLGASVHAVHMLWFSIFLGWAAKSTLQRYGGMKGYTAGLPFFLGLILGDVLNSVVWIVIGNLTSTGYPILPT